MACRDGASITSTPVSSDWDVCRGLHHHPEGLDGLGFDGLLDLGGFAASTAQRAIPGQTCVGVIERGRAFAGRWQGLAADGAQAHLRLGQAKLAYQLAGGFNGLAFVFVYESVAAGL